MPQGFKNLGAFSTGHGASSTGFTMISPGLGIGAGGASGFTRADVSLLADPEIRKLLEERIRVKPGVFTPFPFPTPAPTPSPPAGVPINLQFLLARIPLAAEGHVITSEYHNTLRDAVLALAQLLGAGVVSPSVAVSLAPAFVAPTGSQVPNWNVSDKGASQPAPGQGGKSDAFGWLAVPLPDGTKIQSMTAFGKKEAVVKALRISLLRYRLNDPDQNPTPLVAVSAATGTGAFSPSDAVKVDPNLGATAAIATLEDYKLVDNDKYKYVVTAQLTEADPAAAVQLHAIQVVCSQA